MATSKIVYSKGDRFKVTGKKRVKAPSKLHPAKAKTKAKAATTKTPAQVQAAAVAKALGDITKPIDGKTMQSTAKTLVDREYTPLLADIAASEKKVAANRDQSLERAKGYTAGLGALFSSNGVAQAKSNAATSAAVAAAKADHIAQIGAAQDATAKRLAADAAVRGAGLDGGAAAQAAATTQAATDRAAAQGAAQEGLATSTGSTQEAFLRNLAAASAMRGTETLGGITTAAGNQLADLLSQRTKLGTDRLGKETDTLLKLRQQEREGWLTQQGISSGLEKARLDSKADLAAIKSKAELERKKQDFEASLKQQGWDKDEAKAAAEREFKSSENALDRASREGIAAGTVAARKQREAERAAEKDKKPKYTPMQQRAIVTKVKNAASAAAHLISMGGLSSTDIRSILEGSTQVKGLPKYKFDHDVVNAAMDLASPSKGYLSPANVKYLHGFGIVLQNYGLPTKKPKGPNSWVSDVAKGGK